MRSDTTKWRMILAALLAAVFWPTATRAETMPLGTIPESGIAIEVEAWSGMSGMSMPGRDAGLVPLTITITNKSPVAREWTVGPWRSFGMNSPTAVPVARIVAPAGGTAKATIHVDPGLANKHDWTWLIVRGFGLTGGEAQVQVGVKSSIHHTTSGTTPTITLPSAISASALAVKNDGKGLGQYLVPSGVGLDMTAAPDDWRGWSIFSSVLFTESEWIAMSAAQRKAFFDWVGLGGRAGLMLADASPERLDRIGVPAADPDGRRRVGAGEIVPVPWDGTTLANAEADRFLAGRTEHPKTDMLDRYVDTSTPGFLFSSPTSANWIGGFKKLFDTFGPRRMPAATILAFLAIFGLVAGPLNLMVLAGPGKRSRMFWTTPLISLVATAFLLGLMIQRDGFGGSGSRRVLGLLMPDHNGMAIIQEQFSRTGVLVSSSFPIREPSWMRPLGAAEVRNGFLEVDGRRREGDWFRSRSDQGYLLETVRPSRAKVEFLTGGDGKPAVISSIEVPLDRLFVIDDEGKYWTAADVGTGEKKPLERSDAAAYGKWFDEIVSDAGPIRQAALEAVRNRRGHAYAESDEAAKVAVQTLGSIRWIDDKAAFIGPVTRTTAK